MIRQIRIFQRITEPDSIISMVFLQLITILLGRRVGVDQVLGWMTLPFYLCHQTEEHAYDLRGWRYAFVPNFNHGVSRRKFNRC